MKVLHVIGSVAPQLGGPSKAVIEMAQALIALGHEVEIVTTNLSGKGRWFGAGTVSTKTTEGPICQEKQSENVKITSCSTVLPSRWATSFHMISVLREKIPQSDLVHIHSLYLFPTLVASWLCWRAQIPYIIRPHGTLDPLIRRRHRMLKFIYHRLIEDRTLRKAAAVHFTSEDEEALASPVLPPGTATKVLSLAINTAQYEGLAEQQTAKQSLGIPADTFLLVFIGRMNFKKGLDLLGKAFLDVCDRHGKLSLLVAGPADDSSGTKMKEFIEKAGLSASVSFLGYLELAEQRTVLAAADTWILPSYSENFGLAVVEAMAAGVPVIITDRVNIWRAVSGANAGIVVKPAVPEIARAITRMVEISPAERRHMGDNGRSLAIASYSWGTVGKRLEGLYASIIGTARS